MPELRAVERTDVLLPATDAVDHELRDWFDAEALRWADVDESLGTLVDDLARFALSGGKRIRPVFVHWGFVAAGGDRRDERWARLAAGVELLHAFALLHDDVMDGSVTRRGQAAYHVRRRAEHRAAGWRGESRRFGDGLAILLGDLAFVYADQFLAGMPADVLRVWNEMRVELTMGQYLDVAGAARGDRDLTRSELIACYKSGRYSVERPLHLGAALAGRLDGLQEHLSRYGAPVGEAFQLRDDLLGALGDEEATGKPVGDDLREGKPTVLLAYAHGLADADGRRLLDQVGAPDLSDRTVAEIQSALVECGAVAAVERDIERRVDAARAALDLAPLAAEPRAALSQLAELLAWRDR